MIVDGRRLKISIPRSRDQMPKLRYITGRLSGHPAYPDNLTVLLLICENLRHLRIPPFAL
jgi:hypothetical protein